MSSIYQDKADQENRDEMESLLRKRAESGWTQADAERYEYLKNNINRSMN